MPHLYLTRFGAGLPLKRAGRLLPPGVMSGLGSPPPPPSSALYTLASSSSESPARSSTAGLPGLSAPGLAQSVPARIQASHATSQGTPYTWQVKVTSQAQQRVKYKVANAMT